MKFLYKSLIISLLCFYCFLFPISVSSKSLHIDISGKSGILVNRETGAILWEKDAYTPRSPASTTKVFTALYAADKWERQKGSELDELVIATSDNVVPVPPQVRRTKLHPYRLEYGGTHMGIQTGEALSLQTLFYGLMLVSGNDAANMIAHHVSGSVPQFMDELNAFLRQKGCLNTQLFTPHGMPYEEHKTTAYDLSVAAREFLKKPFLKQVVSSKQAVRPATNKQPEGMLYQKNALLRPGKFYYPRAIGIKTGYTLAAGFCIVAAAEDENRKLIAVILGCDKNEQRYQDVINMFDAAFNEKKVSRKLFSKGFDSFTCQLEGGKMPLQAQLVEDLVLEYYPSEEPQFKTQVVWQHPTLPILSGETVAQLQVLSATGVLLKTTPLYALKAVEPKWSYQVVFAWQKVKSQLCDHIALVMASLGVIVLAGTYYRSHATKPKK